MDQLSECFRALGEPTRLRLLRLVNEAPLNVSELVSVVGVAQSSVSHHLAKLKSLELIKEDRNGAFTYYSLAVTPQDPRWPLIGLAKEAADEHGDRSRLRELLLRREDRQILNERLLEPGQSWMLWSAALGSLVPPLEVADFGCGTGSLTVEIAKWAKRVTAVDRSERSLAQAKERATREGRSNVTFIEADLSKTGLPAGKHDLVVLSQTLHHVARPGDVLKEAHRILVPGGRLLVLELLPHTEAWVQERLGHVHLGFDPEALRGDIQSAGFQKANVSQFPRDGGTPFRVFLVAAEKRK